MATTNIQKNYFKRKYRKNQKRKKIIHQSIRLKIDKGLVVTFPQNSGGVVFDIGNTDVFTVSEIISESPLAAFSRYWGYYQLYGIAIEATPTKNVLNHYPSVYIGFLYSAGNVAPAIDSARSLENSYCLPAFGSDTVKKFWYINTPWIARAEPQTGYFWIQTNENSTSGQGPKWEVRLSCYIRFKLLQM